MYKRQTEHLGPQRQITRYLNDPTGDRLRTRIVEGARQRVVGGGVVEGEWSREGEYEGTYYRFDRAGNMVARRDGERDLRLVWDANQRLVEMCIRDRYYCIATKSQTCRETGAESRGS